MWRKCFKVSLRLLVLATLVFAMPVMA
jgi:uncharacterized protein (TIGR02246 family)